MVLKKLTNCAHVAASWDIHDIVTSDSRKRERKLLRGTTVDKYERRGVETVQRRRSGSFVFDER